MAPGRTIAVPEGDRATEVIGRVPLLVLLYALAGGVVWWAAHLAVGAALANGVCSGTPRWLLTVNNLVCAVGVLTALAASFAARRPSSAAAALTSRSRFLGDIAIITNLAALALVILESIPVYVLGACS